MSKWRVGGKVPLNVYEDDVPMFQCHTPEQAARIVQLLNQVDRLRQLLALVYYGKTDDLGECDDRAIRKEIDAAIAASAEPASKEPEK